jgi:hypothetical protein
MSRDKSLGFYLLLAGGNLSETVEPAIFKSDTALLVTAAADTASKRRATAATLDSDDSMLIK